MVGIPPGAPSADNVADILEGSNCTIPGSRCAHDLGNLVFDAYEEVGDVVEMLGENESAFGVYKTALLDLVGEAVTPASLHDEVGDILIELAKRSGRDELVPVLPDLPDSFNLTIWRMFVSVLC